MREKMSMFDPAKFTEIVSGKAKGADLFGEIWAEENNIPVKQFPADWDDIKDKPGYQIGTTKDGRKYWKVAGHYRNEKMCQYANSLIVFWDGISTGTKDVIKRGYTHGLDVHIFFYK